MSMIDGRLLKIYHTDHFSFKKLRDHKFFSLFERLKNEDEKRVCFTALVELIRSIGSNDKHTKHHIITLSTIQLALAEQNFKVKLESDFKKNFSNYFYDEYINPNYIDFFRGDVTEYVTMYLFKSTSSTALHEPTFKHKKRVLVPKNISGAGCLIDIVKVIQKSNEIHFYECKADLNNFIKKKKKPAFINKLNYMDYLEVKLPTYTYDSINPIKVYKNFVSLNSPTRKIPSKYSNYVRIDLLTQVRLKRALV